MHFLCNAFVDEKGNIFLLVNFVYVGHVECKNCKLLNITDCYFTNVILFLPYLPGFYYLPYFEHFWNCHWARIHKNNKLESFRLFRATFRIPNTGLYLDYNLIQ